MSTVQWHTASPLWSLALGEDNGVRFRQPAILRFASDTFMTDLDAQLKKKPEELKKLVARGETWSTPSVGWMEEDELVPDSSLKLYQPAHGRFYLVAASLVCRVAGLPDKTIDTANEEKTGFVLRRLVARTEGGTVRPSNPATYVECGWQGGTWVKLENAATVAETEERFPMFPMTFQEEGRPRRLMAGLVPVASRETYQAGAGLGLVPVPSDVPAGDDLADPRLAQFDATVALALLNLRTAVISQIASASSTKTVITIDQAREVLAFGLLDLADFLKAYLPDTWRAIPNGWAGGAATQRTVFDRLNVPMVSGNALTFVAAIDDVNTKRTSLLAGGINDPDVNLQLKIDALDLAGIRDAINNLRLAETDTGGLHAAVKAALTAAPTADPATDPVGVPKIDPNGGSLYVIRCVYDRPHCPDPGKTIVSAASPTFQLAPFFDPDAPARPVRITMPVDTSVDGLRKFPKSVSFLISDQLRRQLKRMEGLTVTALEKGELNSEEEGGGFDLGMICSFSIPIITICAMILLMIIIQLLNIVFWWIPFFKICFPLNLKAKPA